MSDKTCMNCRHSSLSFFDRPCTDCYCKSNWAAKGEDTNPYWERICKLSEKQRAKGIEKYGYGLEDNPAGIIGRLQHLEEELLDGLMYIEWIKDKLAEDDVSNGNKENR